MLLISLPFSKKGTGEKAPPPQPAVKAIPPEVLLKEIDALRRQIAETGLQLEIAKIIIERYSKFIEDGEAKSIAELRGLVKPLDHAVVELKIGIQDAFHPYVYEKNFMQAVQKALDMTFAMRSVTLPVNFWLEFEEMQRLGASDDIDKAIFLCSLMRSLGSESVKVLITRSKDAMVVFEFSDQHYVVEIAKKSMSAYPSHDDSFLQITHQALYTFNDREYEDLSEG